MSLDDIADAVLNMETDAVKAVEMMNAHVQAKRYKLEI